MYDFLRFDIVESCICKCILKITKEKIFSLTQLHPQLCQTENFLLGDLNFHLDQHDTWSLKFYDILEPFRLTQFFSFFL